MLEYFCSSAEYVSILVFELWTVGVLNCVVTQVLV